MMVFLVVLLVSVMLALAGGKPGNLVRSRR
jgi:hypothetical protein